MQYQLVTNIHSVCSKAKQGRLPNSAISTDSIPQNYKEMSTLCQLPLVKNHIFIMFSHSPSIVQVY